MIGQLLGFKKKRLSPHDLRHFFTFDALEHGLSLGYRKLDVAVYALAVRKAEHHPGMADREKAWLD